MKTLAHALPVGTQIGGYEITSTLGAGGFGITYKGYHRILDRHVAIKEFFPFEIATRCDHSGAILPSHGREAIHRQVLSKFEATTTDLARLVHPNIVRVHDYYPGNNTGYMIMEYIEGQTFEELLDERGGTVLPSDVKPILDPVLNALEYLHGVGLIHRDIAPDNIMICRDQRPVLIDFGATSQDRSASANGRVSTIIVKKVGFTAPDQASGTALPNPTADIYSLGGVLYRAFMGSRPIDGEDRLRGAVIYDGDPYVPLEKRPPRGVSIQMAQAIDRCLRIQPKDRPQSIAQLRKALDWTDDFVQVPGAGGHDSRGSGSRADPFTVADILDGVTLDDDLPLDGAPPEPEPEPARVPPPPPQPQPTDPPKEPPPPDQPPAPPRSRLTRWAVLAGTSVLILGTIGGLIVANRPSTPEQAVAQPASSPPQAQTELARLEDFGDWSVYQQRLSNGNVCFMQASSVEAAGRSQLQVIRREQRQGGMDLLIRLGYTRPANAPPVKITVGRQTFTGQYVSDTLANLPLYSDDDAFVAAIRSATGLIRLVGRSAGGEVTETFRTNGTRLALDLMRTSARCPFPQ